MNQRVNRKALLQNDDSLGADASFTPLCPSFLRGDAFCHCVLWRMVMTMQMAIAGAAAGHQTAPRTPVALQAVYLPSTSRAWLPRQWQRQRLRHRGVVALESSSADVSVSTSSPESTVEQPQGPPIIELRFLSPNAGGEVQTVSAVSGDKVLRTIMKDSKLELYDTWGKVMNCGGGGSCGTCIVQILEGQGLLNDRTDAENKYLKKKPDNWRLSCQTIVGDKTNSGKVVVQRLPQRKK